jgi:hypothetical protein
MEEPSSAFELPSPPAVGARGQDGVPRGPERAKLLLVYARRHRADLPPDAVEVPATDAAAAEELDAPVVDATEEDTLGAEEADVGTETEDDGACAAFCKKMFPKAPEPLLPRPSPPPKQQARRLRTRGARRTLAPTRSSQRLAARPSSTPVAQRAQLRLMRDLEFISGKSSATDAALTEYIDSFGQELRDKAIKALRHNRKLRLRQQPHAFPTAET